MKPVNVEKNELLSDEEIIVRIINGEKHLYEILMRKNNASMYRISMSIINDDMEAEDIMQTAYLNAYIQLKTFGNRSSFSTWLTKILINESLLRKKKKLKDQQMIMEKQNDTYHTQTPLKGLMNKELKTLLEKTICDLPDKYRTVFVLREIEDMSIHETMDILGLTEANVKVRLNRAKEMLRSNLNTYYKSEQLFGFHLTRCDKVVNFVMTEVNKMQSVYN